MRTEGHVNLAYIIIPSSLKPTFHPGSLAGSAESHNPAASDTNSLCQIRGAKNSFKKGSHMCLLFKNPARFIRSSFAWAEIRSVVSDGASLGVEAMQLLMGCLKILMKGHICEMSFRRPTATLQRGDFLWQSTLRTSLGLVHLAFSQPSC